MSCRLPTGYQLSMQDETRGVVESYFAAWTACRTESIRCRDVADANGRSASASSSALA